MSVISLGFIVVVDLKMGEERRERRHEPVWSSSCDLRLLDSLRMQEEEKLHMEEEELHMLASLWQEQEEEEMGGVPGLSVSQVHQCNISISTRSDDTSTWTHIAMVSHVLLIDPMHSSGSLHRLYD